MNSNQPQYPIPQNRPPLKSLRALEFQLGVDRLELRALAENWRQHYDPFQQTKKPKPHARKTKSAKPRNIDNPSPALKAVQKKILGRLLLPVSLPRFLYGGVAGRCIRVHAMQHLGAKVLVKLDVKSFYPNVTNKHVYRVWANVVGCSPPIADLLTKLTTYDWHLPQGAPTSPAIANLFLASIYGPILEKCAENSIIATAWVDDLIFSGEDPRCVMELVRKSLADEGFKLSTKKRQILDQRKVKVVTGVRLGKDRIRACKVKVREIRAGIHNVKVGRFTKAGREADLQSLRAKVTFIRSICPSDAVPLERSLSEM